MKTIATWMRTDDEPLFARSFAFAPHLHFLNGRSTAVDIGAADALLLTGGVDLAAESLPQPVPDPSLIGNTNRERDKWEIEAVHAFFGLNRPILAICRGHQLLNVALGGTLFLDIPDHNSPEQYEDDVQRLRYAPGVPPTRVFERVNSSHHQAVDRLGDGLEVEAWCAGDDLVEQMRHPTHRWCVGVQYHPERSRLYDPLFRSFVAAC